MTACRCFRLWFETRNVNSISSGSNRNAFKSGQSLHVAKTWSTHCNFKSSNRCRESEDRRESTGLLTVDSSECSDVGAAWGLTLISSNLAHTCKLSYSLKGINKLLLPLFFFLSPFDILYRREFEELSFLRVRGRRFWVFQLEAWLNRSLPKLQLSWRLSESLRLLLDSFVPCLRSSRARNSELLRSRRAGEPPTCTVKSPRILGAPLSGNELLISEPSDDLSKFL